MTEDSFKKLQKTREKHSESNSSHTDKLQDDTVKDAWSAMKMIPPWKAKRFINEMSSYREDTYFSLFEIRKFVVNFS